MLKLNYFQRKNYRLAPKSIRLLRLTGLSIGSMLIAFLSQSSAPIFSQDSPTSERDSMNAAESEIGWEFIGSRELNTTSIEVVTYHDPNNECDEDEEQSYREARFTSSETPPARGRSVFIQNVTRGVASDRYPHTERDYDEGRASEPVKIRFGTQHRRKYLHVLPGLNEFQYEIRDDDQILEAGSFTATINRQNRAVQRTAVLTSTENVCANTAVPLWLCADIRTQSEYRCPGKRRVVRRELKPDDTSIKILIANGTRETIRYTLNGAPNILHPEGERTHEFYRTHLRSLRSGCKPLKH